MTWGGDDKIAADEVKDLFDDFDDDAYVEDEGSKGSSDEYVSKGLLVLKALF